MRFRSRRAFTLIELMIIIAILGTVLGSFMDPFRFAWQRLNRGQQVHEDTDTLLLLKHYLEKDLASIVPGSHPRWSARYDSPDGHELVALLSGGRRVTYACRVGTVTRTTDRKEDPPRRFSRLTLTEATFGKVRTFLITAIQRPGLPVLVSFLEEP
jgi:hypothetical protein